jgi:hypothetical protein
LVGGVVVVALGGALVVVGAAVVVVVGAAVVVVSAPAVVVVSALTATVVVVVVVATSSQPITLRTAMPHRASATIRQIRFTAYLPRSSGHWFHAPPSD